VSFAFVILAILGAGLAWPAAKSKKPLPKLRAEGAFAYEIRDADTGDLVPGKITILGAKGTKTPMLTHGDIGREEDDAIVAYDRIFSSSGTGVIRLPLGSYDVTVSRGPEWSIYQVKALKVDSTGVEVRAEIKHEVDTSGWLSGDFHVHAASSPDSRVPMQDRVFEFVADGVDMIVSTDHNVVSDYAPYIADLGLGNYITSAMGDELTTKDWGHFGAFPLPRDLEAAGQGAVLVHGRTAADFFADVRKNAPDALIDVHHPRLDDQIGYFNRGLFDSAKDEAKRKGFSFDFDAVEVLNGYQDRDRHSVDKVIADWFALLNHGHIVTATGNSDTHHLTYNLGGYPRNYVRVKDDSPAKVTPSEVAASVKAHHVEFTTAPFIVLTVGSAGIGDVAPVKDGKATATIEVRAASWVSVSLVRLYLNGNEEKRWTVPAGTNPVRFQTTYDLTGIDKDSWIVVRVDGDKPLSPVVGDDKGFEVLPLALTNPVFLDADGNGAYDPREKHGKHVTGVDKLRLPRWLDLPNPTPPTRE
jgi:hypothetical protein